MPINKSYVDNVLSSHKVGRIAVRIILRDGDYGKTVYGSIASGSGESEILIRSGGKEKPYNYKDMLEFEVLSLGDLLAVIEDKDRRIKGLVEEKIRARNMLG